jgi:rhodanese-related sulfurtransferase
MNWKKHVLEGLTLVVAAVICATVANGLAARERKMTLVGTYPNALKVPQQQPDQPVAAPVVPGGAPAVLSGAPVSSPAAPAPAPAPTTTAGVDTRAPQSTPITNKQQPVAKPKPAPAAPDISKFAQHPDKPYIEIAYADVKALHDAGALFLDARRTSVYEQGHIAGARPFSVWESDVDQKVNNLFSERPDANDQAKPIVVYCSGGDCEDSHMLAQKLWGIQFNNVYVYKDGFPDWQAKGGQVHTGANP